MSKNVEKASKKVLEEPQNDSVFDFLYCDNHRIASFLAQFDDSGHLERVIQRESAQKGSKRGWSFNLGGGSPLLASANASLSMAPDATGSEASERVYDPFWANARTLLDYLEGAKLIQRDVGKARIGQFLLATGSLSVFDMSLIRMAWENPSVVAAMRKSQGEQTQQITHANRHSRRAERQKDKPTEVDDVKSMLDIIKLMPHKTISSLQADGNNVWSILNEKYVSGSPAEIMLKHGVNIQGDWSMIGIVDALPHAPDSDVEIYRTIIGALGLGSMGEAIAQIAPAMRVMLGRPEDAFGVTPILIFREILA